MLARLFEVMVRRIVGPAGRAADLTADSETALVLPPRLIADTLAYRIRAGGHAAEQPDIVR